MDDRFIILTEYFRPAHKTRRKEIAKSIEINCRIPQTKRVIIFIDPEVEFPPSLKRVLSKENYDKIELHHIEPGGRSTYADFFSYANEHLVGENCALCNNDISFDESLDYIRFAEDFDLEGHFICLTRWDIRRDNSLRFQRAKVRKNSQDAWIFKPSIPPKMIERGGFYLGRPGCDGMVSYLATISGLKLLNPSEIVRARHLHLSYYRTYRCRKHRLGGDDIYMCTIPTKQIKFNLPNIMYRFGKPRREAHGQEAIDKAKEFETHNQHHWDYAIKKCRSQ